MKIKVSYRVAYIAEVDVAKLSLLEDAISDINIPEGGTNKSRYIQDSFEPIRFQDTDGKWKNVEDLEFLS